MKIGAIILARLDSARLPEKALINVAGKPILQHVVELCRAIHGVDHVVLATSDRPVDQPLVELADELSIPCQRGSLEDVASRFHAAMVNFDMDAALRVNGDSPLNRSSLLSEGVRMYQDLAGECDIVTNVFERTYPFGVSLEVIGRNAMERVVDQAVDLADKEHVTRFIYKNPELFRVKNIKRSGPSMYGVQLAIDSQEDLVRFEKIVERLGENWSSASLDSLLSAMQN